MNAVLPNRILRDLGTQEDYRIDCEKILLSIVLMAPEKASIIASIVSPSDFHDPFLKSIYQLIDLMNANREPISFTSVMFAAKRTGLIDENGSEFEYGKLANAAPNVSHAEFYAKEVARQAACSKVYDAAMKLAEDVSRKGSDPSEAIAVFENATKSATTFSARKPTPVGDVILSIIKSNDNGESINGTRIGTGFYSLDRLVGGLYTSNLIYLGGRFGMGKSCLASQLVSYAVAKSKYAMIFSMEMTEVEFTQRILSSDTGVSMNAWTRSRNQEEQSRLTDYEKAQSEYRWWIDANPRQTVKSIRSICQLAKLRDKLDLVVIDNLQLIEPTNYRDKQYDQVKAITVELKKIAKELDVAILLLAQLDTEAGRSRPNSTSWASCKAIEGDADLAMIIHRPDETDKNTFEIIVTKNRSRGGRETIPFVFDGEFQRFEEISIESIVGVNGFK